MKANELMVVDKGDNAIKYIDMDKYPGCGGELKFNIHTGKKHCQSCGRLWSFEINLGAKKLIVHEWKIAEKGTPLYDFIMQVVDTK